MKYKLLSAEEMAEFAKTATKAEIIDRILDIMTELGRVSDAERENK